MRRQIIDMLRNAPANSMDFKNALNEATNLEIKNAKKMMEKMTGCKGKISACKKELKTRGCTDEKTTENAHAANYDE